MPEYIAFYLIFSSQILLISYYFPRKMLNRMRYVIDKYPPSTHPKLYPVSIDTVEKGLSTYRMMNRFILLAGVALVLNGVYSPSDEMLNRDSQSVLLFYFMLQYSPLLVLGRFGVKYLSLMRKANSRTTRSAELHPRRLFDFVSHRLVYVAISTYIEGNGASCQDFGAIQHLGDSFHVNRFYPARIGVAQSHRYSHDAAFSVVCSGGIPISSNRRYEL